MDMSCIVQIEETNEVVVALYIKLALKKFIVNMWVHAKMTAYVWKL